MRLVRRSGAYLPAWHKFRTAKGVNKGGNAGSLRTLFQLRAVVSDSPSRPVLEAAWPLGLQRRCPLVSPLSPRARSAGGCEPREPPRVRGHVLVAAFASVLLIAA